MKTYEDYEEFENINAEVDTWWNENYVQKPKSHILSHMDELESFEHQEREAFQERREINPFTY